MLTFVNEENIYNINLVNDQVVNWAKRVNLRDLELAAELAAWRELLNQQVARRFG
jgi:hypothetical protein